MCLVRVHSGRIRGAHLKVVIGPERSRFHFVIDLRDACGVRVCTLRTAPWRACEVNKWPRSDLGFILPTRMLCVVRVTCVCVRYERPFSERVELGSVSGPQKYPVNSYDLRDTCGVRV